MALLAFLRLPMGWQCFCKLAEPIFSILICKDWEPKPITEIAPKAASFKFEDFRFSNDSANLHTNNGISEISLAPIFRTHMHAIGSGKSGASKPLH